jgi:hypothetical protein
MANYFDNFSSYAVATGVPTGFTARWVTTGVTHSIVSGGADKFFRQNRSGTGRGLVTIDAADGDANRALADVLVRVKLNNPSGGTAQAGPAARCSGSAGSENGYVCYPVSNKLRVAAYKAGASSTILESATLSLTDGAWYWIRLRVEATTSPVTLRARIWADGSGEPGTWDVNTTDSSSPITGAGWCGMFAFGATTWDTDDIAVGTNGDTASMSGGGGSDGTGSGSVSGITLTPITGSGSGGAGGAVGTGVIAAVSITPQTGTATGTSSLASLTIGPLKNNTGTLLASQTGITVHVYQVGGSLVVTKSAQTTNASGIMTVTDAAMVAGTTYRFVIVMSSGAEGMDKLAAA